MVNGLSGLHTFKTFNYLPDYLNSQQNWALEGSDLLYGKQALKNSNEQSSPAIIDTGSSTLGVPEHVFKNLHLEWKSDLQNSNVKLDCTTNDNFCQVKEPCS